MFVVAASMDRLSVLALLSQRLDLSWASQGPRAANVDITLFFEIGQLEVAKHGEAVVVGVVIVPLVTVGVNEKDVVGELVVVIDDIAAHAYVNF